jgi:hypothetical protein
MTKSNLILIGSGGHACSCIDVIESHSQFKIEGLVGMNDELNFKKNGYSLIGTDIDLPVILAGGVGNVTHLEEGLNDKRVDAVATANLFNFVGDGLKKARESLISNDLDLPLWDVCFLEAHLSQTNQT